METGNKSTENIESEEPGREPAASIVTIQAGPKTQVGEKSIDSRIDELRTALKAVEREFGATRKGLAKQIENWSMICILSLLFCGYLSYRLLNIEFTQLWTWQYIYYTSIRITIAGVTISLLAFLFKMLRSYINLLEQIRHKIMIVRSMANLVGAGTSKTQRDLIYYTLTQKLIELGSIGILSSENDFKQPSSAESLELLEKLINKKD